MPFSTVFQLHYSDSKVIQYPLMSNIYKAFPSALPELLLEGYHTLDGRSPFSTQLLQEGYHTLDALSPSSNDHHSVMEYSS